MEDLEEYYGGDSSSHQLFDEMIDQRTREQEGMDAELDDIRKDIRTTEEFIEKVESGVK